MDCSLLLLHPNVRCYHLRLGTHAPLPPPRLRMSAPLRSGGLASACSQSAHAKRFARARRFEAKVMHADVTLDSRPQHTSGWLMPLMPLCAHVVIRDAPMAWGRQGSRSSLAPHVGENSSCLRWPQISRYTFVFPLFFSWAFMAVPKAFMAHGWAFMGRHTSLPWYRTPPWPTKAMPWQWHSAMAMA